MANISGLVVVSNGGVATGDVVLAGGVLFASGGTLSSTTVSSGGFELIADGSGFVGDMPALFPGIAVGSLISAGGQDLVFNGGLVFGTVVAAGGLEVLEGPATGFVGADIGTGNGTTLSGGVQIVFGRADDTTVISGTETVWSGGVSVSSTLDGRTSFEFVVGGTAVFDVINNAGQFLVSGGTAQDTQVNNGGVQVVGGASRADTTSLSGTQIVSSGGTAANTAIWIGGVEIVQAGGVASGTFLEGGLMEVQSGGSVAPPSSAFAGEGAINFGNGGVLQLDFSQGFTGTIAGFASPLGRIEGIDLVDIAFGKGTSEKFTEAPGNASGTLTVTDGTHTANLTLLGQYSTAMFSLASDGHGGTMITDPSLVGSAASPLLAVQT